MTAEEKLDRIGDQLSGVAVQIATLTGDVAGIRSDLTRTVTETARDLADHEVRIRTLEQWRWAMTGAAAAFGAGSGALVANFFHH